MRASVLAFALLPQLSWADGFDRLQSEQDFLTRVAGREIAQSFWGIRLVVRPDGTIDGSAMGWAVTGEWRWENGLFCRQMDWSGTEIPPNCQMVEVAGEKVRFTSDAGQGDSATFNLR